MAEAQILEIPECKRGRFVATPATEQQKRENGGMGSEEGEMEGEEEGREESGMETFIKNHSNTTLLDVEPPVGFVLLLSMM